MDSTALRAVLMDHVSTSREEHVENQEQFTLACELFTELIRADVERPDEVYSDLCDEIDRCAERAVEL